MTETELSAGVIGVGTMGQHHARVYKELPDVRLAGVADANPDQATQIATKYGTVPREMDDLLDRCDLVSLAVPTRFHYETARQAIENDVNVLIEKPLVRDVEQGKKLVALAHERDVRLQVGHVERFNPAVQAVTEIVSDLDVIAVDVRRLGPPVDRDTTDSVVFDLMIHDIDVLAAILGSGVSKVSAIGARDGNHVTAQIEYDNGVIGNLTASRVTQEKVRDLAITAQDCRVNVDYNNQSVQIHRHSLPEYYESDGDIRYRHESIIERPTIENGEPLRAELASFVNAVRTGTKPEVTGQDGLEAIEIAREIESKSTMDNPLARQ